MIQNDIAWNCSAHLPPAVLRCEVRVQHSGKTTTLDFPVRHQDGWRHAYDGDAIPGRVLQWRIWSKPFRMPREARNKPVHRGHSSKDWFERGLPGELVDDAIRGTLGRKVKEGLR